MFPYSGPDGRPQVEVVLRFRLPLAEFFDALLLTLAEQHPISPQGGRGPPQDNATPVQAGLLDSTSGLPYAKAGTSPKKKAFGRAQPKKPAPPETVALPAAPTHEKLLAILSQAGHSPSFEEQGGATSSTDPLPASVVDTRKTPQLQQTSHRPPQQAKSSGPPTQHYIMRENVNYRVLEDGTHEHMPPSRAFAHPKKCPVQ